MNIPVPKYGIGHVFWVARCRLGVEFVTKIIDGVEYTRRVETYIPYVKQKEVRSIYIVINYRKKVTIEYKCVDYNTQIITNRLQRAAFAFPIKYTEEKIGDMTEAEAMALAQSYADKEETYFGDNDFEDQDDD
jgi:hypothetical protein